MGLVRKAFTKRHESSPVNTSPDSEVCGNEAQIHSIFICTYVHIQISPSLAMHTVSPQRQTQRLHVGRCLFRHWRAGERGPRPQLGVHAAGAMATSQLQYARPDRQTAVALNHIKERAWGHL
jgi:hypothetical protein